MGVKADGSVTYANPDYWYCAYFRNAFDPSSNRHQPAVKALQARLRSALGAGRGMGDEETAAGLPYEIYVIDGAVHAPHGRFRIALASPDVGMGQFMRISIPAQ